jgi:beta-glucanase (GH16 family)
MLNFLLSCTDGRDYGCERTGSFTNVLNPIKSASLTTNKAFSFKYGKVEVRAKMPRGDWLWPSIVMLPKANVYGDWPASGQFVLVESRGNGNLTENGENIGLEQVRSAILAGPNAQATIMTSVFKTQGKSFHREFHRYQMEWTPDYIQYKVDERVVGKIDANEGFYKAGDYEAEGVPNPWTKGTLMAPFDQEFYLQIQLAVGGVSKYFPDVNDDIENPGGKPWLNDSPQAATDFWTYRNSWLDEWDLVEGSTRSSLMVDYIKIWSLR